MILLSFQIMFKLTTLLVATLTTSDIAVITLMAAMEEGPERQIGDQCRQLSQDITNKLEGKKNRRIAVLQGSFHTALVMKMTRTLALSPLPPLPFVFSSSSSDI